MKLVLQDILDKRKITQTQLAKDLGITNVIVSNWCNNKRLPSWNNLQKLADYLKVEVKDLLK